MLFPALGQGIFTEIGFRQNSLRLGSRLIGCHKGSITKGITSNLLADTIDGNPGSLATTACSQTKAWQVLILVDDLCLAFGNIQPGYCCFCQSYRLLRFCFGQHRGNNLDELT